MAEKKTILTGDRPTGALHTGHYTGSLKRRKEMFDSGQYNMYLLVADLQALTDNAEDPEKIRENILEVTLDNIGIGIDPTDCNFVVQSQIPALYELPMYYSNLVTMARLERNPTVKTEIAIRNFARDLPVGFMTYPISQAADITAFGAHYVPVGSDQLPMLEQTREIVHSFNRIYRTDVLVLPEAIVPEDERMARLVGTDGDAKMSKSMGNCIYLKDKPDVIRQKVMNMFTDPDHLRISDPGKTEGNPVFIYLNVFGTDELFRAHCSDYGSLGELEEHYRRGGLGDVYVKKLLNEIMQDVLRPIRERREEYEKDKAGVLDILRAGTDAALGVTNKVLGDVREAIGINYFSSKGFEKYL
ncbi:MAG: tryptophan--tRNA ligase [Oscillospiraceae bacterium]|nr:tryptophan--tRNA ligase [Oscillospiraceae bacterium]